MRPQDGKRYEIKICDTSPLHNTIVQAGQCHGRLNRLCSELSRQNYVCIACCMVKIDMVCHASLYIAYRITKGGETLVYVKGCW